MTSREHTPLGVLGEGCTDHCNRYEDLTTDHDIVVSFTVYFATGTTKTHALKPDESDLPRPRSATCPSSAAAAGQHRTAGPPSTRAASSRQHGIGRSAPGLLHELVTGLT
jgi:hypothetical protein